MSKKRRTVSLEPEVDEYLSQSGRNASELVNDLVKKHMNGGATEDEILEFRIQQVKSQREDLAGRLEQKDNELSTLKERKEQQEKQHTQEQREKIETMAEYLSVSELGSADQPFIDNDNSTVQELAEKANCSPEELREEAIRQYKNDWYR